MSRLRIHTDSHNVDRIGWLRAAVLGANDGIVSAANLIVGVAAASAKPRNMLLTGVAGAMSMAAGEYGSVSSQSETERAELAQIYVNRGLDHDLAVKVADQLLAKDALGVHARDELGISEIATGRPVQAALTSAATFSLGAAMPLAMVLISPRGMLIPIVSIASLGFLVLLGATGVKAGGGDIMRATARVTFGGVGDGRNSRYRQTLRCCRIVSWPRKCSQMGSSFDGRK